MQQKRYATPAIKICGITQEDVLTRSPNSDYTNDTYNDEEWYEYSQPNKGL